MTLCSKYCLRSEENCLEVPQEFHGRNGQKNAFHVKNTMSQTPRQNSNIIPCQKEIFQVLIYYIILKKLYSNKLFSHSYDIKIKHGYKIKIMELVPWNSYCCGIPSAFHVNR